MLTLIFNFIQFLWNIRKFIIFLFFDNIGNSESRSFKFIRTRKDWPISRKIREYETQCLYRNYNKIK